MRHTVTSCNYTWDSQMMSSMTSSSMLHKRELISTFRSVLMKTLDWSVETLGREL